MTGRDEILYSIDDELGFIALIECGIELDRIAAFPFGPKLLA
jgi:hypothetical protein